MAAIEPPETDRVRRLLRRRPPAAALGWAAAAFGPGGRVVAVRPLSSSWLANHAVDVADGAGAVHRMVLRRWARPGWEAEDPDFTAARVPPYRRFYDPRRLVPPPWSARPRLWERAFAVAAGPPPDGHACFIHRDYHPANTLWTGGRLTGVVDWIGGSRGPPSVDLGHMRVNLAADLGLAAADRFLAAHRALTGFDHHPWWDVASAVDVGPELEPSWRRVEDLVAAALARLGG